MRYVDVSYLYTQIYTCITETQVCQERGYVEFKSEEIINGDKKGCKMQKIEDARERVKLTENQQAIFNVL